LFSDKCCAHSYYGFPTNWLAANHVRKVDAVTFACVLIKAEVLRKVEFDEKLPVDYNDISYCIDAGKLGYTCYYTPWAISMHFESITKDRGRREDFKYFYSKHREILKKYPTQEEIAYSQIQGL